MALYTIRLYQGERCTWIGADLAFRDEDEAIKAALIEYEWLCLHEDESTEVEWRVELCDGRNHPQCFRVSGAATDETLIGEQLRTFCARSDPRRQSGRHQCG